MNRLNRPATGLPSIDRRLLLRAGAAGAGLLGVAACSTPSSAPVPSPTTSATTGTGPTTSSAATTGTSASASAAAPSASAGPMLRYARTTGPTSLDPQATIVSGDVYTLNQIFEPLYITDTKGELQPHLATGHTVSADGKTYVFTLRKGVLFSDGAPMTATDVAYSLLRNKTNNGPLSFLNGVIASATATTPTTVTVKLTQPWAPFISDISVFSNSIVPAKLRGKTAAQFFAAPVGTGPFILASWVRGGTVTLAANPKYWGGAPKIGGVLFSVVADDNTLVEQLQAGQVDVIDSVPSASVSLVSGNSSLALVKADQWSVDLLLLNEKVKFYADRHVRRAISHAVNRAQISKATTNGTATPAGSFFPPSLQYYDGNTKVLGYDIAAAKAELAQSAYPKGFTTSILVPASNQAWYETAQILQASLAQIGITVKVRSLETAAYKSAFEGFDDDMFINNAINDISDPDEMASFQIDDVHGGSTSFWTGYHNPAAIKLVYAAEGELDDGKRKALYAQIQQIVADDAPYVPLTYPPAIKAIRSTVKRFVVNPAGAVRLEDVTLA